MLAKKQSFQTMLTMFTYLLNTNTLQNLRYKVIWRILHNLFSSSPKRIASEGKLVWGTVGTNRTLVWPMKPGRPGIAKEAWGLLGRRRQKSSQLLRTEPCQFLVSTNSQELRAGAADAYLEPQCWQGPTGRVRGHCPGEKPSQWKAKCRAN